MHFRWGPKFFFSVLGMFGILSVVDLAYSVSMRQIEVQGHRGARAVRPENTIPAFQYALEVGVDTIELDVGVTKDQVVVVSHDPWIDPKICRRLDSRLLEQKLFLKDLTSTQVKTFDCGSSIHPDFPRQQTVPGTRIPTLEEVFQWAQTQSNQNFQFNIETKIHFERPELSPPPKEFAQLVLNLVQSYRMQKRVVIQSFDFRILKEVRKLAPELKISTLVKEKPDQFRDFIEDIQKSIRPDIFSPLHVWLDSDIVKFLHSHQIRVIPWTANTPSDWTRLLQIGVDGIITDDPKSLIEFLSHRP